MPKGRPQHDAVGNILCGSARETSIRHGGRWVRIEIVRLPEGESGVRKGNLTQERQEALAEYWGSPEKERAEKWGDPAAIGKLLGISAATVRKSKLDKRVKGMITEALNEQLLYDVIEARAVAMKIIRDEKEKADTRLKGWRTLEQMKGNLNAGGPVVNITNDFSSYEGMSDEEILGQFDEHARRRGWRPGDQALPDMPRG